MYYDDVVNYVNSGKKLFELGSLFIVNRNLLNFKKIQFNMSLGITPDDMSHIYTLIGNEIIQNLEKRVVHELFNSPKFDYLDLVDSGGLITGNFEDTRKIYRIIMSCPEKYTSLITNGAIASCLQDLQEFTPYSSWERRMNNKISNGAQLYEVGRIGNIKIYVDPYMKYNDSRLVLFNNIDINIENINSHIQSQATFNPQLVMKYDFDFIVGDSRVIFILDHSNHPEFMKYKSLQRDIKITNILDEQKEEE
jgi:hypothetical protein